MPSPSISAEDRVRLQHMREAGEAALNFVEGVNRDELGADQMRLFAVVRALEIIGEAANSVSKGFQQETPQIAWPAMIGMRNILIHHYFAVEVQAVWLAVTEDVPRLIVELDQLLRLEG